MNYTLPALALLAVVGLVASGGDANSAGKRPGPSERRAVVEQIQSTAARLEWPILPDLLTAIGYTESRFNANATNRSGRLGVFQLTPGSALVFDLAGYPSNWLFRVPFAVVAAAYYTVRLAKYRGSKPTDELTGLDIRRGWAYPRLVSDYDETEQRSRDVRRRLEEAEAATGVSVANRIVFPPGWSWIGTTEALRRVGAFT